MADDYEAQQVAEYGKWVASEVIFIGGARAFNPGDPVPVSHVEGGVVDKSQVVGAQSKTAAAVKEG
jgi:hypothetical protein